MERYSVGIAGRDQFTLELELDERRNLRQARLQGVGGPELLKLLVEYRPKLTGNIDQIPLPPGTAPAAILLRELLLRAQGRWTSPYQETEMCHCRLVSTANVDMAIVGGAHTPERVSRETTASTACGTCRPQVQNLINYRLAR